MGVSSHQYLQNEIHKEHDVFIKEEYIHNGETLNLKNMKLLSTKAELSVCEILTDFGHGTGFFRKVKYPNKINKIICLITNNHVINEYIINNKDYISIKLNDGIKEIYFDSDRKIWTNEALDFTCIEILEEDNIQLTSLFEIDDNCYNKVYNLEEYKDKGIITIGVGKKKELLFPQGIFNFLEDKKNIFFTNCNTESGFSGGPIILVYNLKIIGIHKGYNQLRKRNIGIYMKEIIKNLKKENEIQRYQYDSELEGIIDTKFYSRQIYTFGINTMKKIIRMKVLIFGMRGLGIEIAKNIILMGVNEVQIYDPKIIEINDLGSNFYLSEDDVGHKRRDEASLIKLSTLNPYVKVSIMEGSIIDNINNFNVIIITEIMKKEKLIHVDEICRKNKIGFIYCGIFGLSGFLFNDFGEEYIILNEDGKNTRKYLIRVIEKEKGIIWINNDYISQKCDLSDGDYVRFYHTGIDELNDGKPRKIKLLSAINFIIDDKDNFSKLKESFRGGYFEKVKIPKMQYHDTFKRIFGNYSDKKIISIDSNKVGNNKLLYISFQSIHDYFDKHNYLPKLNDKIQTNEIINQTKKIFEKYKQNLFDKDIKWNEEIPNNVASWARAEISPICSFLGGIVSNEIIKKTGVYVPINQLLLFDFFETTKNLEKNVDRDLIGSRYDDQISIYGRDIQDKIENSNTFLAGVGSVGCELLKNLSLMGIGTKMGKEVVIADGEKIKLSNLNSHFLFRKKNIGLSKSECAKKVIEEINPNFNCKYLKKYVNKKNYNIFNEKFFNNQTYIISSVDDINSRKYIEQKCVDYFKSFLFSLTFGNKALSQMTIPYKTSCYNDEKPFIGEDYNDFLTIRNGHVLKIGKELFIYEGMFSYFFHVVVKNIMPILENEKDTVSDELTKKYLEIIINKNIDKIIELAIEIFIYIFNFKIRDLKNHYTNPLEYDSNDEMSFLFVKSCSIILSKALSIDGDLSDEHIKEVSSKVKIPPYKQEKKIDSKIYFNKKYLSKNLSKRRRRKNHFISSRF